MVVIILIKLIIVGLRRVPAGPLERTVDAFVTKDEYLSSILWLTSDDFFYILVESIRKYCNF